MNEKQNSKDENTSWEDVVYSNMIQTEALAQIMVEKGLMSKEEFSERVARVHRQFMKQHPSGDMSGDS